MKLSVVRTILCVGGGLLLACGTLPDSDLMEKAAELEQDRQYVEALNTYRKVAEKYPAGEHAPVALYKAGLISANALQDYEAGIRFMEKAAERYPESRVAGQCRFMIGFVAANSMQDTSRARAAYETFLSLYPDHELVPSVEWELRHLGKSIDEIPDIINAESLSRPKTETTE